jgi:hypothetical protein
LSSAPLPDFVEPMKAPSSLSGRAMIAFGSRCSSESGKIRMRARWFGNERAASFPASGPFANYILNPSSASKILQLQLIDHVIIGSPAPSKNSYFSFKEGGVIS